jgi:nucleotide-binding universal stress UspA family protein
MASPAPPRLLVAFDDSPPAATAVRVAAALFPAARADVLNVHPEPFTIERLRTSAGGLIPTSVTASGLEELDRGMLRSAAEIAGRGLEVARTAGLTDATAATTADPRAWRGIIAHADAIDADAIVCGGHGAGVLARAVLGSVAESVLHAAQRPVIVVPADAAPSADGPIVIAYDGSPDAQAAIATAGRLLSGRRAIVVHAWTPLTVAPGLDLVPIESVREMTRDLETIAAEQAAAVADEGAGRAAEAGLSATALSVRGTGNPWHAVAQAAEDHDAALVVAGSRGQGRVTALLLGSVSSGLVHNATRPTLIVH